MRRIFLIAPMVLIAIGSASAQSSFPVGRTFKVISISGFDVQNAGITLTVGAEGQSNRLVGSGNAGCNTWNAQVVLREDQIDLTNIATTRKMCPKARMTTEEAFIRTLTTAQRWRLDERNRLIIEGEAARLLLTGIGGDKQPPTKDDKKAPQKPAEKPAGR